MAFSYIDAGRLDEAEFQCEQAVALSHENSLTLSLQGILQAASGNTSSVRVTLDKLLRMKDEKYISSANIASLYAALRDEEKTLGWLEKGLEERDPNMTWIKFDGEFKFLQYNDRFQSILQEVGLTKTQVPVIEQSVEVRSYWKLMIGLAILTGLFAAVYAFTR